MRPEPRTARDAEAGGIRERILDAAMAILREDGIQALSQVQVARRAEVRQSHLTYYFPKRRDLIDAVATRFIDGIAGGLGDLAGQSESSTPGAVLERIAAAIAEPGHMRMFAGVIVAADADPELRGMVARVTRRMQSTVAELLGGDDAMERARLVLASMWGLGLYDFVVRPKRGSASTSSFLADMAGAAPGGPRPAASPAAQKRSSRRRRRPPGRRG